MKFELLFYILLCAVVGMLGSNRTIGWVGWTIVSIMFTPFVALIFLTLTHGDKRRG